MSEPLNLALTSETYSRAVSVLCMQESSFASVVSKWGNPPFWTHSPGFPGIVIDYFGATGFPGIGTGSVHQAGKCYRFIHPESFLSLDDDTLRAIGFSRQKASYVRGVARGIMAGEIDLEALESMDNDDARKYLMELRGIGAWTADTYLLFSLRRADVWPSGDLALSKAIQGLRFLAQTPGSEEVDGIARHWRPWRAVAARILWHHYLCERGRIAAA